MHNKQEKKKTIYIFFHSIVLKDISRIFINVYIHIIDVFNIPGDYVCMMTWRYVETGTHRDLWFYCTRKPIFCSCISDVTSFYPLIITRWFLTLNGCQTVKLAHLTYCREWVNKLKKNKLLPPIMANIT